MLENYTKIAAVPLRGGCRTSIHKSLLSFGEMSEKQNIRDVHPGFRKRPGQIKLNSTADSTNSPMTLYQFRKRRIDETHFFAQMSDGDILEATNAPPVVTTGAFGSEVFDGSASQIPASWGNLGDILIHSNGVDQHKLYAGTTNYVDAFIVYKGTVAPPNVPVVGEDYSDEVSDGLSTTVAILDSLDTLANHDCLFICTPIPANRLTWTITAANANAATGTLSYRKNDNTWADTTETDGTISGGATLAVTGAMTWTHPADEIPCYMYGISGYWYRWVTSAALDAEVEVSTVTYGSAFQNLVNVWDGVIPYAIEAQHYDKSAETFSTYATGYVDIGSMEHEAGAGNDDKDRLYFNSSDPIMGIYVDVGSSPNTAPTAVVYGVKAWTGSSFATVGTITDGTNGLNNSGWITWPRLATVQPTQFQTSQWYSYWYYFWIGTASLSADTAISILTMPYFDITEFGRGQCNCIWKDRPIFSFTLYPNYIYAGAAGKPCSLNGNDYGILMAGDGRRNKVVAMRKFHNELVVFQEERGYEGGCITLFQGYSPTTFGKLLISDRIGTMNDKSAAVVDGVMTSTRTEEKIKDLIFFLSRHGICATDGLSISIISDDIQNYFDPTQTECIRRGCEDKMWLSYDSAFNILRLGLVSGISIQTATATSTSASKLADTAGAFTTKKTVSGHPIAHTIAIGDTVYNTTDGTSALITAIDSATALSLDTDIMTSGEGYEIYSATCNLFPVFDLIDKAWSFDLLAQNLSCVTEVEAGSGNATVIQVGGGIADGFVYRLNTTTNDISTAIDSFLTMELNSNGEYVQLNEMMLRAKAQTAGNISLTLSKNSISAATKTLSMIPEITNQTIRRHRFNLNLCDQNISVKIQHNTAGQECEILDIGLKTELYKDR